MTAAEIRQSFLDFFREKQHTIVQSASLMPQSPGLLFTNAGMNPFVPYFLGVQKAPYGPPRAADTQKCIRAGGKHNDLEDVGYDTYHHTFFEMLGNWSFGDYFKAEAIQWAWELVVQRWGFPASRLYATVYAPKEGDPGEFDQEAYDHWARLFQSAGLDPQVHIVHGNVKDNFWMMGETGPCGPCSELHFDLTEKGDTKGSLVNEGSDKCIEIWNLVFIQYNAEADGSFRELPAKHVDTGMGFERVCSMIEGTKNFTDFSGRVSNYGTDVFRPILSRLEELSGKRYADVYPEPEQDRAGYSDELKTAIAFRVIADHLRTLSFSIADGILPGNNGRNYVLRRILRRAVRYGRQLGFSGEKPFFGELVGALVAHMGDVFPELKSRESNIRATLEREESSFNETLDRGLKRFEEAMGERTDHLSGDVAFELYDTYGFPLDLTELLCAERGVTVDTVRFEELMEQQRERARAAQKSTVIRALDVSTDAVTEFVGFELDEVEATVLEVYPQEDSLYVITDKTPFYSEMGGQVGDVGTLQCNDAEHEVKGAQPIAKARAHIIDAAAEVKPGDTVTLKVDITRRRPVEAHHTATHLLHWALHEVVSADIAQQGSSVDEERLRFDFNSGPLTDEQLREIEVRVNAAITANDPVSWSEVPYAEVKGRPDIMQFFGDKYSDPVRVVQIGGKQHALDGYSMELCGGTHVRTTGQVGLFKIRSEGAIASGVRRIEAVCGERTRDWLRGIIIQNSEEAAALQAKLVPLNVKLAGISESLVNVGVPPVLDADTLYKTGDVTAINEALAKAKAVFDSDRELIIEAEKRFKKLQAAAAASQADEALADLIAKGDPIVADFESDAALLQELLNGLKKRNFGGPAFVIVDDGEKLHLGAYCGAEAQAAGFKAGDLLRELAAIAGGKGGGKPDQARGAAPDREKLDELKAAAADRFTA